MEKFSLTDIRKKNYSDVYHFIYREKRSSKQQIATALQMSLPTVTQHLTALNDAGLIEKNGLISSNIGRKAAAYMIKPTAKAAVGVEILTKQVTIVVLDLYGQVITRTKLPIAFTQEEAYFDLLAKSIQGQLDACHIQPEQVLGVGFGLQGLVSEDGCEMLYGKILDCTGLHVDRFQAHLAYPCRLIHDSECAAALELWHSPDLTDALYLSLGSHFGGAVISDGQIKTGRTGRTGTFEHMTLIDGGKTCYCGKQGCVECYCSASALLEEDETLEQFFEAVRQNNRTHTARWTEYLNFLAMALNNLHMVLDSWIILGGHIAPFLTDTDLEQLFSLIQERTAFPENENFLRLGVQEKDVVAIGAAIPFVQEYLSSI
ncbi:MAG: ROK family transcriptional regulator [Eubacteriales bacterium]|nr:ROK family transcriptional regulator [Eubacteriales bacterium]